MTATPASAPVFRHQLHHLRDPDEFGAALSGADLVADFLSPQARPTRIEQFQTPDWGLDFQEAHVKARIRGPLPPGWASLGFMRGPVESEWSGFTTGAGILMCNPPGEAIDGRIVPGFSCFSVGVPQAVWEKCRLLSGVERTAFGSVAALRLPPSVFARIEQRLHTTRQLLTDAAAQPSLASFAAREATDLVIHVVTTAWELSATAAPPRDALRNRARLARRAEAWMRAHLTEEVRMPDVCLALRVSRRELEYAFRSTFDQSPRDFLQMQRLNAVRRALLRRDPDDTILRVLLDHGLSHPSRFALDYRALFGERPSETRSLNQSGAAVIR